VARVEINGKPNGTAFLIDSTHVATALHVLKGRAQVELVFVEWEMNVRRRTGLRVWRHPAGIDLAVLELDRACPEDVEPLSWSREPPVPCESWMTFGFPAEVSDGHPLLGNEYVVDPQRRVDGWDLRVWQLFTPAAHYSLAGMSGAPCVIEGEVRGVLTHQLCRHGDGLKEGAAPSPSPTPALHTVFALPLAAVVWDGMPPAKVQVIRVAANGGSADLELFVRIKHVEIALDREVLPLLQTHQRLSSIGAGAVSTLGVALLPMVSPMVPVLTTVALAAAVLLAAVFVVGRVWHKVGNTCAQATAHLRIARGCLDSASRPRSVHSISATIVWLQVVETFVSKQIGE